MKRVLSWVLIVSLWLSLCPMGILTFAFEAVGIPFAQLRELVTVYGRTATDDEGNLQLFWTNSGFSFRFNGTGASVKIAASTVAANDRGYVNVYVDGAMMANNTICVTESGAYYELVSGLAAGEHTVEVRKRSEAAYSGSATLTVQELRVEGELLSNPPAASNFQIEFIGDSLTSGFGNLVTDGSGDYTTDTVEGTMTWAVLAAKQLGAEAQIFSRSGIGFCRNTLIHGTTDSSLYPYYTKTASLPKVTVSDAEWDFASDPSDVVVICLGGNDSSGTINGETVTDDFMASEAVALIELVRANNPDAIIIWTYGFTSTARKGAYEKAIPEVNAAGDDKVFYLPMPTQNIGSEGVGTANHPTVQTHINRSHLMAAFISEKTGRAVNNRVVLEAQLRWSEQYLDETYLENHLADGAENFKAAYAAGETLLTQEAATNEEYLAAATAIWDTQARMRVKEKSYQVLAEIPYSFNYVNQLVSASGSLMACAKTFDAIDLTQYGFPATGVPAKGKLGIQFDVYLDGDSALAEDFASGKLGGSFEITSSGKCDVEERSRRLVGVTWTKGVWYRCYLDLSTFTSITGGALDPTAFNYIRIYMNGLSAYAGQMVSIGLKNMCLVDLTKEIPFVCGHETLNYTAIKEPTLTEEGYTGEGRCKKCDTVVTAGEVIPKLSAYAKLDFSSGTLAETAMMASGYTVVKIPGTEYYGALLPKHGSGFSFALTTNRLGFAADEPIAVTYEYYIGNGWHDADRLTLLGCSTIAPALYGKYVGSTYDTLPVNNGGVVTKGQLATFTYTVGSGETYTIVNGGKIVPGGTAMTAGSVHDTEAVAQKLMSGETVSLIQYNSSNTSGVEEEYVYIKSITIHAASALNTPEAAEGVEYIDFEFARNPIYYPQYTNTVSGGLTMAVDEATEYYAADTEKQYPRFNYGYVKVNALLSADRVTPKSYLLRIYAKEDSKIEQIVAQYQKAASNTAEIVGDERWSAYYTLKFVNGVAELQMKDTVFCNGLNGGSSIRLQDVHYAKSGDSYAIQTNDDLTDIARIEVIPVDCFHDEGTLEGVKAPTCTEAGYTGDRVCGTCGEVLVRGEAIDPQGHDEGTLEGVKEPTCTEAGYTGDRVCGTCGEVLARGAVIDPQGHDEGTLEGVKAPTCTEAGYTGDRVCGTCGEVIAEGKTITASGHTWDDGAITKEPTATEDGEKTFTCTVCGETKKEPVAFEGMIGDVDGNNTVDSTDARLVLQYAVRKIPVTALNLATANVDGNSTVDSTDARLILQLAVGKIQRFPAK